MLVNFMGLHSSDKNPSDSYRQALFSENEIFYGNLPNTNHIKS